jgi:biotin operon repressor
VAERESVGRWRSVANVRFLLEQQFYSSEAYGEELDQDRVALVAALQALRVEGG